MRTAFYGCAVLNIAVSIAAALVFQQPLATHFGLDGDANGWMSPRTHAFFMTALTVGCCGMFALFDYLATICPGHVFNVPNAAYWHDEKHLPELRRLFRRFLLEIGVYLLLFLVTLNGSVLWANRFKEPRLDRSFEVFVGIFLAVTMIWMVRMFLAFRIPKEETPAVSQTTDNPEAS